MKNKNLTIAIVIAALAALILFAYLSSKEKEIVSKGTPNKVIVAKRYIPAGATISADLLKETEIPENYIQPGAIRKAENAAGRISLANISEGEQVLANKITNTAENLSSAIPIGYRAVAISVDSVSGINDMIKVGDVVDVIGTFEDSGAKGTYTATVLQNVRVLAINDKFDLSREERRNEYSNASLGLSTISLALEPSEAEILAFAENKGKLKLALRNPGDDKVSTIKTTNFSNLLRSQQKEVSKPAPTQDQQLEIIRGTEGEKVNIKK